jgi:hypothetical protein
MVGQASSHRGLNSSNDHDAGNSCSLAQFNPLMLEGDWYELASQKRSDNPCICSKFEITNKEGNINLKTSCLTPTHKLVTGSSRITFAEEGSPRFEISSQTSTKDSFRVVQADLLNQDWIIINKGLKDEIMVFVKDPTFKLSNIPILDSCVDLKLLDISNKNKKRGFSLAKIPFVFGGVFSFFCWALPNKKRKNAQFYFFGSEAAKKIE